MSRIHQLDSSVVNKIAAGEVIERPATGFGWRHDTSRGENWEIWRAGRR